MPYRPFASFQHLPFRLIQITLAQGALLCKRHCSCAVPRSSARPAANADESLERFDQRVRYVLLTFLATFLFVTLGFPRGLIVSTPYAPPRPFAPLNAPPSR